MAATKANGTPAAASAGRRNAKDGQAGGEYSLNRDGSTGQEWIVDAYRALEPGNYLREFASRNVRPDGRTFSSCRPASVQPAVLTRNARGSAVVTLGQGRGDDLSRDESRCTRVVAACTLLVGRPGPSTPDDGDVDVILSASPLSGPRFDIMGRESGEITSGDYGMPTDLDDRPKLPGNLEHVVTNAPDEYGTNVNPSPTDVKEIESWIRRTLRSSRYVNPQELGIERGISAWRIRISIHVLNHEGNVRDAALLGACAALADLRIPAVEIDRGTVRVVEGESGASAIDGGDERRRRRGGRALTLGPLPVPLTIAILPGGDDGGKGPALLADPTRLEEDVASGNTATVVCNANEEIVGFRKGGSGSRLSVSQMAAIACMGFRRARELEAIVLGRR
ncbi:hypothetical protein ACHAWF_009816 [Thalassiosira exigua]